MSLAEFTVLLTDLSKISELKVVLIVLFIAISRFLYKKIRNKTPKYSSLYLQDSEKQIKYKGSTIVATLIVLLSYFRKKT